MRLSAAPPGWAPTTLTSSTSAGLRVTFTWSPTASLTAGFSDYMTGFLSSWSNVCTLPSGEVLDFNRGSLLLHDVTASGNTASGSGGIAVIAVDGGYAGTRGTAVTVEQASWQDNVAGASGGALAVSGAIDLSVSGATMVGNAALSGLGGCMSLTAVTAASVLTSWFESCVAYSPDGGGGAIAAVSTLLTATHCSFAFNAAETDAGALMVRDAAYVVLVNCSMANNTATGASSHGGALSVTNVTRVQLVACKFTGNSVVAGQNAAQITALPATADLLFRDTTIRRVIFGRCLLTFLIAQTSTRKREQNPAPAAPE